MLLIHTHAQGYIICVYRTAEKWVNSYDKSHRAVEALLLLLALPLPPATNRSAEDTRILQSSNASGNTHSRGLLQRVRPTVVNNKHMLEYLNYHNKKKKHVNAFIRYYK